MCIRFFGDLQGSVLRDFKKGNLLYMKCWFSLPQSFSNTDHITMTYDDVEGLGTPHCLSKVLWNRFGSRITPRGPARQLFAQDLPDELAILRKSGKAS